MTKDNNNDINKSRVVPIYIEDEMRKSYLDYSMSVIVSRALPDVRDGLKPVHRRILYTMQELNLYHNKAYKKSARVVGDTMGRYHPHGNDAIYNSIVRLAQDFSLRYPLVDGQGNFGSIDGDSAAAMRYTEVRMLKITEEMLKDIDKDTVDFVPNFDDSLKEPVVLPAAIPNLLLNGVSGIAVGMATNIPPHNLTEIIEGLIALIKNPQITISELREYIKGPDFPTGGMILGTSGIKDAYETGKGRVVVRGRIEFEEMKNGKTAIIIKEIPYVVNKADMIQKIAALVNAKRIEGISDIRDESDRDGMRVVIELKKTGNPKLISNLLYKHTQLQSAFNVNSLALVNYQPKVLNLKQMLEEFLKHRHEVIVRRLKNELEKAEKRAHILEGLLIALNNIDEIIQLIKTSESPDEAKTEMMKRFELSEEQSKAILEMRLQRLTALEQDKIKTEYNELMKRINEIKEILGSEALQYKIIADELVEIKEKYGDERKTEIIPREDEGFSMEDLIADRQVAITITHRGYINRVPVDTYSKQRRGGVGIRGMQLRDDDFLESVFVASTHDYILFITNNGNAYYIKVYDLPEMGRTSRGKSIYNYISLDTDEVIKSIIPLREFSDKQKIFFATKKGKIKKCDSSLFRNAKIKGINAMNLKDDDSVVSARLYEPGNDIMLITRNGLCIRFDSDEIRSMGRTAMGVRGIRLGKDDEVVEMGIANEENYLFTVTEFGIGKKTRIIHFRKIRRGGKGVRAAKLSEKTGKIAAARQVEKEDEVVLITDSGNLIRVDARGISTQGRNASGVRVVSLKEDQKVIDMAILKDE